MRTDRRRYVRVLLWAAFAVAGALLWPVQLGGATGVTVVSGHSMEPTFRTGDVVVTRRAAGYRTGDVVVYRVRPGEPGAGLLVVHRITGGDGVGGFVTRGDNNPGPDIWEPVDADVVGRVVASAPKAGLVLAQARNPMLYALVGSIVVGAILWRDDAEDAEQAGGASSCSGLPRAARG